MPKKRKRRSYGPPQELSPALPDLHTATELKAFEKYIKEQKKRLIKQGVLSPEDEYAYRQIELVGQIAKAIDLLKFLVEKLDINPQLTLYERK